MYHYAGNNPIKYVDPTGLSDEDVKSFCLEDLVDILDTVVSGTSNILKDLGLSFPGISKMTDEWGFIVNRKTVYDYDKLKTAEKLDGISKVFLGVAILVNVIDVCKVAIDNPDNPDAAMKHRFIRNATTLGLSYIAAGLGSKIGQCFGEFVGSKIGSMLGGAAGTAVHLVLELPQGLLVVQFWEVQLGLEFLVRLEVS